MRARRVPRDPISEIDKIVQLMSEAKNVLVLTGAGVSTSCGIPDFRSENGVYACVPFGPTFPVL